MITVTSEAKKNKFRGDSEIKIDSGNNTFRITAEGGSLKISKTGPVDEIKISPVVGNVIKIS